MDWIACDKELPDADMLVLTFAPNDSSPVWPAVLEGDGWRGLECGMIYGVTHWANLPEGPQ